MRQIKFVVTNRSLSEYGMTFTLPLEEEYVNAYKVRFNDGQSSIVLKHDIKVVEIY